MLKKAFAIILTAAVLMSLAVGCGGEKAVEGNQTAASSTADAAAAANSTSTEVQATPQKEVAVEEIPTPDPKSSQDSLVGDWKDISSPDRTARITKTDAGYQFEDNDGKYPAEFKDGVLKVKVTDTDTADVYIDAGTGHLFLNYQGDTLEYSK